MFRWVLLQPLERVRFGYRPLMEQPLQHAPRASRNSQSSCQQHGSPSDALNGVILINSPAKSHHARLFLSDLPYQSAKTWSDGEHKLGTTSAI